MLQRYSVKKSLMEKDLLKYANVSWPQHRIPRIIHQTYRTYNIPEIWNTSIQSIIETNYKDFQYHRWSHEDMRLFVQKHQPEFYRKTYINYKYDMQRIDSFRYVLMYHVGGIYIDMDNGCNYPLKYIVTTMEALDPYSPYLALFPAEDTFGLQTDFIISTSNHPIFKQFISNLHLFNHNYLLHHLTILLSAGPLYATFQERFFNQTEKQIVRILDNQIYNTIFWKTNGGTWFERDTLIILYIYYNRNIILKYCVIILIFIIIIIILFKRRRIDFLIKLTIKQSNHIFYPRNFRRKLFKLFKNKIPSKQIT
ncbi:unnamed protein product [Adineta steineri]|uniref:Uncharacterized protein n=1 Tax=Adineta steineri TaxID=433720 RepID=A0A819Q3A5_9BILA|nr:unnamed protein product [Adineta steineri]CAF4022921.1 unnamed protein product [Adineta steineri]